MWLKSIRLTNFRNLKDVSLADIGRANVIVGRNGQGKTNLLEGVYVLGNGGSFRVSGDEALIRQGEVVTGINGILEHQGKELKVDISWNITGTTIGRTIRVNGQPATSTSLFQSLPFILFAPEEVDLLRLTSSKRRKIVDAILVRYDAEYRSHLGDYIRIWRQRNQLLLTIKQHRASEDELDVWDEKIAEAGVVVAQKRMEAVNKLSEIAAKKYQTFAGENPGELRLNYLPSIKVFTVPEYIGELKKYRSLDIVRAHTTHGIHRDDILFVLNGRDAKKQASRGEFRSIVLTTKIAEGEILKEAMNENPIYLFDDVMSELDDHRRQALINEVGDAQVFITTHEDEVPTIFNDPMVYKVEDGVVESEHVQFA